MSTWIIRVCAVDTVSKDFLNLTLHYIYPISPAPAPVPTAFTLSSFCFLSHIQNKGEKIGLGLTKLRITDVRYIDFNKSMHNDETFTIFQ